MIAEIIAGISLLLVVYWVRAVRLEVLTMRLVFEEAVRRGLLGTDTPKALGAYRSRPVVEADEVPTMSVEKKLVKQLTQVAEQRCCSPAREDSINRCPGMADPRCGGGNCSAHCNEHCPAGCREERS